MVYGLGLPKTGTTTLIEALKILGYKDSEIVVGDYVYFLDHDKFDGKMILTVRESPEKWFDSVEAWSRIPRSEYSKNSRMNQRKKMYGYAMPQQHKDHFIGRYNKHNAKMRKYKPLVVCWEKGDGWYPLCAFLNKPIPKVPFPHLNKQNYDNSIEK